MAYVPVSQRAGETRASGYTPVSDRSKGIVPQPDTPVVTPSYVPVAQRGIAAPEAKAPEAIVAPVVQPTVEAPRSSGIAPAGGISMTQPRAVAPKATLPEIQARGETISATPKSDLGALYERYVPKALRSAASQAKAGLVGEEVVDLSGDTVQKSGLLVRGQDFSLADMVPFGGFRPKTDLQRFNERQRALEGAGVEPTRAADIARESSGYGMDDSLVSRVRNPESARIERLNLNDTEKKVMRDVAIFEYVDRALSALDVISVGVIGRISKSAAARIAASTDEVLISKILQSEIKTLPSNQADQFAKVFKHIDDADGVQTALRRLEVKSQEIARAGKAGQGADDTLAVTSRLPSAAQAPVLSTMAQSVPDGIRAVPGVIPAIPMDSSVAKDLSSWTAGGITGSEGQLPAKTISYLRQNPIGVSEIPVTGDTVTLYRDGDVTPGKAQSYSLERIDPGQVPVEVPRANILANMNSPEVDALYGQSFTEGEIAQKMDQRKLNKFEREVIAISPKATDRAQAFVDGYVRSHEYPSRAGLEQYIESNPSGIPAEEILRRFDDATGLTLKPSESVLEVETAKGKKAVKPSVNKTDLKTIIRANPEFRANPVLTVDANDNLTFNGETSNFKIKARALGLNEANLVAGDRITVDVDALKVVGGAPNMRVYKEGNVFASVGDYADGSPISLGQRESVNPIELPEMVQLAKDIMGSTPAVRTKVSRVMGGQARGVFMPKGNGEIRLRADLFDPKVTNPDQVAKVLAHEIGHLVDYLPERTLKRGNILGRLNTLRSFYKDIFPEGGVTRDAGEVKAEMWKLSKLWRPVDEATASPSFLEYRKSGKEIYADFISVLFNDPKLAQSTAPAAYNAFFDALDKKPLVKEAYFELQATLSGDRNSIIAQRRLGVQKMFKEGDIKSIEYQRNLEAERIGNKRSTISRIKFNLVDNNTPMIERVRALEKRGVSINMDEDPRYLLEERNYMSGLVKAEIEANVVPIMDNLKTNNITWDTFGEALFYERIIGGDRSAQANPRGITTKAAQESYDALRGDMTPQQFEVLKSEMDGFRAWLGTITESAYAEGLYKPELYAQMRANPSYVTFQVLDHIENGITSTVYKSIGTLKDITNPANASILKAIATMKATERNKIVRSSVRLLEGEFKDDVMPADKSFNGKTTVFKDSRDPRYELITFKEKGVSKGYYVDKYIAHSLNNDTVGRNNAVMSLISPIRWANANVFRPLFIGYNPGFHAFNLIRDLQRFWKNMPGMTLPRALRLYYQAMPAARARAFGIGKSPSAKMIDAERLIMDLEREKVLGITFNDFSLGKTDLDSQIDVMLRQAGIEGGDEKRNVAMRVLNTLSSIGNYIETLPKVAGALEMTKGTGDVSSLTKEQGSFLRKNIGSPDFLTKGYASPVTNELFLFSNAITQGIKTDIAVATEPKTRSGYWWKTAKVNLLPKLVMFMASVGLFGEWMRDQFSKQSEYDKTTYTTIPLGEDGNGKAIYLRLPQDQSGQMVSSLFWKILGKMDPSKDTRLGQDMSDVMSFMGGQVPGVTPSIGTPKAIYEYLSGQNPYDSFRGRNVLTDELFRANNWETDKAFLGYVFSQVGGNIVYNFASGGSAPTAKSTSEEIVRLPVVSNTLGRFIKVSDYGTTERLNKAKSQVQSEQAAQSIEDRKLVNKYAGMAIEGDGDRAELAQDMVTERFGGQPRNQDDVKKAKALIERFNTVLTRGVSGPEIDALSSVGSNAEKTALLKKIQETMPEDEYGLLIQAAIRNKVISPEVMNRMR